jgi:hypothetical protein
MFFHSVNIVSDFEVSGGCVSQAVNTYLLLFPLLFLLIIIYLYFSSLENSIHIENFHLVDYKLLFSFALDYAIRKAQ